MWIFMVMRQCQCIIVSRLSVMTCVHIAETGGERSWSGSEYWRAETLPVVTRPHSIIITP